MPKFTKDQYPKMVIKTVADEIVENIPVKGDVSHWRQQLEGNMDVPLGTLVPQLSNVRLEKIMVALRKKFGIPRDVRTVRVLNIGTTTCNSLIEELNAEMAFANRVSSRPGSARG